MGQRAVVVVFGWLVGGLGLQWESPGLVGVIRNWGSGGWSLFCGWLVGDRGLRQGS